MWMRLRDTRVCIANQFRVEVQSRAASAIMALPEVARPLRGNSYRMRRLHASSLFTAWATMDPPEDCLDLSFTH